MSHIPKKSREQIDQAPIGDCKLLNGRELSYAIMVLARPLLEGDPRRQQEVIGALEQAKQELYRLYIKPFEKQEQFENGGIE
jgi:hypothetical protein